MSPSVLVLLCLVVAGVGGILWRKLRIRQAEAAVQRGIARFGEKPAQLAEQFLTAADATGKPRGLRWKMCELSGIPLFATDRVTGELYALVTATINFEAIPGGGMEEVEAVGNLRCATAVFVYRDDQWTSDGRAVFNLEPPQALERYAESLAQVAAPPVESAPAKSSPVES